DPDVLHELGNDHVVPFPGDVAVDLAAVHGALAVRKAAILARARSGFSYAPARGPPAYGRRFRRWAPATPPLTLCLPVAGGPAAGQGRTPDTFKEQGHERTQYRFRQPAAVAADAGQ